MMDAYTALAAFYDEFNSDVPYEKWADFIEKIFRRHKISPEIILDLACGTGTLSYYLSLRGYEMIASDQSDAMLCRAREKCEALANKPVFIMQTMQDIDLYGTVGAVICCLDSVNYVTRYEDLVECFRRVHLFLEPGGVFLFDINTEYKLRSISGQAFISEAEGAYCAWRASFSEKRSICRYDFDLFVQEEDHWNRFFETHFERAYKVDELKSALREAGFSKEPVLYGELRLKPPEINAGRIFFAAQKEKK